MNKQELIEAVIELPVDCSGSRPKIDKLTTLELIKLLDEPKKVTVPQFVAEYIEQKKDDNYHLLGAMDTIMTSRRINLYEWFYDDDNIELFAQAWIFGYEVEKEPKYTVRVKGINGYGQYLNKASSSKTYCFASEIEKYGYKTKHTRKQLEDDDFGWVFDCPGVEVEEVEE